MRILLVSHGLPPESVGGVEQHVEGLATALVSQGHDVHVYTRTGRTGLAHGELVDEVGPAGIPVTRVAGLYQGLESLEMFYRDPRLDAAFERFLDGRTFDVAHAHHVTGISTGLLNILQQHEIPTVLTLHDYFTMCPRGQMWHPDGTVCERVEPTRCGDCLRPTFGLWIPEGDEGGTTMATRHRTALETLSVPDTLVVPSARAIPPFRELGLAEERIRVIENGVDVERLHKLAPPPVTDDPSRPLRLAYLGALIPSKGLDVLVDAIATLEPGRVSLDVFGNAVPYHGDESFLTKVFSKLRPDDRMTYHGPYTTEDLPHILAQVDMLAAPALWAEAFGLTVREALAAGRPVIVSAIGGLQDAIEDGVQGLLVPPGDVGALAGAIDALDRDRERLAGMVAACRSGPRAVRGFQAMATELGGLYADLTSGTE